MSEGSPRRQFTIAALVVLVAIAACIAGIARLVWERDPVYRGGRLLRDTHPAERVRGLLAIEGAQRVLNDPSEASVVLPEITNAVGDESAAVRCEAIRCLYTVLGAIRKGARTPSSKLMSQTEVKRAMAVLVGALRDGDPVVRAEAASVLGALGPDSAPAASALRAAMQDPDPGVRRCAIMSVGRMSATATAFDPLQTIADHHDSDPGVRIVALETCQSMHKMRSSRMPLPRLLVALEDPDRRVRTRAVTFLQPFMQNFGFRDPIGELTALSRAQRERLLPVFFEALSDRSREVRLIAADCVWATVSPGQEAVLPQLESIVGQEQDTGVSWRLDAAVGRIGGDRAFAFLLERLGDSRHHEFLPDILAMSFRGTDQSKVVLEHLAPLLTNESPALRRAGLGGIAELGPEATGIRPQIELLANTDPDENVRKTAKQTLVFIRTRTVRRREMR